KQGRVSTAPHVGDDFRGRALGSRIATPSSRQKLLRGCRGQVFYAHHCTILLSGYSTMSCAFAALSFGIICRTTSSSTIVLIATQSGLERLEIVGFFRAGNAARTASRFSRLALSISPTLL